MAKAKIVREAVETSAEFARKAYDEVLDFFGYGADADEIMSEVGNLSPQTRNVLKALERDDFLGFETPDQALKQFIENPVYTYENYDISPQLKGALTKFSNNPPSKPSKTMADVGPRVGTNTAPTNGSGLLDWIGRPVDDLVKQGYPESVAKRISSGELPMDEASRLARAAEQGYDPTTFYKGLHPYPNVKSSDLGALAILEGKSFPAITEIQRQGPFPSFGGKDGDIPAGVIAGFYSPDHKVSNYFAPYQGSATYPLKARLGRVKEFDAAGKKAGQLQFGDAGKDFRDAARSGEYDTIILRNTADEGDVHISLNAENIRSPNAAFDPEYTGSNILGSRIAPTAAAGLTQALTNQDIVDLNQQVAIDSGMTQLGYDKDRPESAMYNYSDILPVRRHKDARGLTDGVLFGFEPAMTGILEEAMRGLIDVGESRKTGRVQNPNSIWDALL